MYEHREEGQNNHWQKSVPENISNAIYIDEQMGSHEIENYVYCETSNSCVTINDTEEDLSL